jgi:anti-sigma factor RsiW
MHCDRYAVAIGELVDGTITGDARRDVEAHLQSCEECSTLVSDLQRVRELAGTVERLSPPAGIWPRVARDAGLARASAPTARWSVSRRWMPVAAAAALVLAAGTAVVLRGPESGGTDPVATPNASQAVAEPGTTEPVVSGADAADLADSVQAELRKAEQHYESAIVGLERLTTGQQVLDPQVAADLTKNLQVIDQAIDESRAALRTEPTSEPAQQSLLEAFRTKVGLLQDTIALINEMRKGNQAEAARIAEGLNKS